MVAAAASSKVVVKLTASVAPPASDTSMRFSPVGPTRSTSMSSGKVLLKDDRVTVTLVMVPARFVTSMFDGYGFPFPESHTATPLHGLSAIGIVVLFENVPVSAQAAGSAISRDANATKAMAPA